MGVVRYHLGVVKMVKYPLRVVKNPLGGHEGG